METDQLAWWKLWLCLLVYVSSLQGGEGVSAVKADFRRDFFLDAVDGGVIWGPFYMRQRQLWEGHVGRFNPRKRPSLCHNSALNFEMWSCFRRRFAAAAGAQLR